jgi:hypothetical protein
VDMSDWKQASGLATVDLRPPGGHHTITAAKVVPMTWNSLDLNLLRVFNAIMQERTLTRAGQRLGMSQPAMSHALARLRHMLKDDLFVRTPDGMCPTPRAGPSVPMKMRHRPTRSLDLRALKDDLANAYARYSKN